MPLDPVANGTWIGVNDAGLTVTLLNVYPGGKIGKKKGRRRSRGLVVRELLACGSLGEVRRELKRMEAEWYPPFCVLAVDAEELVSLRWDGRATEHSVHKLNEAPFLYVSSGLGDEKVIGPRRELFEEMLLAAAPGDLAVQQDRFHGHLWPKHPELSVCMARADARTVSVTTVEVIGGQARLWYHGAPPDEPCDDVELSLSIVRPSDEQAD